MNSDPLKPSQDQGDAPPRFLESKPLRPKQARPVPKKQWILLTVLSLFLVFLVFQTFAGGKKKPMQPASKAQTAPAASAAPAAPAVPPLTPENDIFQAPDLDQEGRPSPFTRAASAPGTPVYVPSSLVLQGVLSDSSGSVYAVINEKIVKKGERMADKVVTTIQSDSVTLRSDSGEEMTLRMKTS